MLKAFLFISIQLLFVSSTANCQNLSGTWEGYSGGSEYWRLGIVQINDSCYCYSYDEGDGNSYCNQNFRGYYNKEEKTFEGQGINFISRTFDHVLIATSLRYKKEGKEEYLTGTVRARSFIANILLLGSNDLSRLRKISNNVDSTAYIKSVVRRLANSSYVKTINADTITNTVETQKTFEDSITYIKNNRATNIVKNIFTAADTVIITLYDDGEPDGDIVTVFDNDKIVVNKLTLTKKPYRLTISLPANNPKHTVELMAENEGSIPPNTAYMLIEAGAERVEVKASSNKLSNAAIIIQKNN